MVFAKDLSVPEAPVLLPDRSWLVVEMGLDRGCVTHLSPDGKTRRVVAKTGRPNGLALDKEGVIWVAESCFSPSATANHSCFPMTWRSGRTVCCT
jgi:gluconolactonase